MPWFRFEIAHIQGRIRFFFVVEKNYRGLLEGQLYAHYPNIEITETTDYISDTSRLIATQAEMANYSLETIKLYTTLKDKTEKESVDPLSSLTSALSKVPKNDIAFFHINFSPIPDSVWRTDDKIAILGSDATKSKKRRQLYRSGLAKWLLLPFHWLYVFFRFLLGFGNSTDNEHTDKNEYGSEQKHHQYGYHTEIWIAKEKKNTPLDTALLRELSSSLNIYANPSGNKLVHSSTTEMSRKDLLVRKPKRPDIFNVAELAGLVHLPTVYVRTPGVNWVTTRKFEPPHNLPSTLTPNTPIGVSNFR